MKIATLIVAAAAAILLNSCNTTAGLGRDVRKLGTNIEQTANEAR